MDRFQALQIFVKVAELGGFAAASRDLGLSPPGVTRAIAGLEDRLGARLFVRTTRSVRLTETGMRFLGDAKRILTDLAEAEEAAVGSHAAPRGELRITAPVLFGRLYVTPILGDYLNQYAQVNAETMFVDRVVNLMDEGLDVAIRIGDLPDSSLSAIRVGVVRRVMFAAPEYLARYGIPQRPRDLTDHRLIHSLAIGAGGDWAFQDKGKPLSVKIDQRLRMNTNDAVIELALRGWGLSRLMSYQVAAHLAEGQLQTVLEEFETEPLPIHVLHGQGRRVSAKIRSFVDYMVERLRADATINF
ncbi:MAG: LysR family transcriptional regulator [Alphaproteobacteria bacterium]|jgi:DNA-binding transcriptional LysR family regulator|nr:LysR family transcriptional regulator [Alphaproteobacteria bacterium]MBT4966506.1 LysR family transcriptional regulator [Alphaproteobacteria bacterium]MBT5161704.1 LysR family transcriptional regulator [Alphaproteobacteria bacterium]MBT6385920.1 LysR family transcriptional regulator [Alphaproteobacteria bacterium]